VIITRNSITRRQIAEPAPFAPDIFEYVYFARPDSVMDGISVYRSRMSMGDALAEKVKEVLAKTGLSVDVVIPVRIFSSSFRSSVAPMWFLELEDQDQLADHMGATL